MTFHQLIGYNLHNDKLNNQIETKPKDPDQVRKILKLCVESIEIDDLAIVKEDFAKILQNKIESRHNNSRVNCKLYVYEDIYNSIIKIEKETNKKYIPVVLSGYDLKSEEILNSILINYFYDTYMIFEFDTYNILLGDGIFLVCFDENIEKSSNIREIDFETYQKCINELKKNQRVDDKSYNLVNFITQI